MGRRAQSPLCTEGGAERGRGDGLERLHGPMQDVGKHLQAGMMLGEMA